MEAGSRQRHNGSNKQAKARQSMAGVDEGSSRVAKNRRTSDLSVEKPEMATSFEAGPSSGAD